MHRKILFVTPDLDSNSLGRTYCLWLLAKKLGWAASVVSFRGSTIWKPLIGSPFAADCELMDARSARGHRIASLTARASAHDVVIAVKAMPESFGVGREAAERAGKIFVLDIDDPDLEVWQSAHIGAMRAALRFVRHPVIMAGMHSMSKRVGHESRIIVSNPLLQQRYGGVIIPHVRESRMPGRAHISERPSIAFIGTARKHKGIQVLRDAVAMLANQGFSLTVTDSEPSDSKPWESWLGAVPFHKGMDLLSESDIVAIPTLDHVFARGQLPAKLIDAMIGGRAIVASSIGPIPWALSDGGLLVQPGNARDLALALLKLKDPSMRQRLGDNARSRALDEFTLDASIRKFYSICTSRVDDRVVRT